MNSIENEEAYEIPLMLIRGHIDSIDEEISRIFFRERHTKWATSIKVIKACLNETYQETIKMTPYEAQFEIKPTKDWEKYIDPMLVGAEKVDISKIHLRVKEKANKQADRINKSNKITKFKIGDQVLVRMYKLSDATQNIISKFCALYEGPYVIIREIGNATYLLQDGTDSKVVRGVFNVRQLKPYHSDCLAE